MDYETQKVLAAEAVGSFVEEGDLLDRARPIDHFSYFETRETAIEFANWLSSQGYQKIVIGERDYDGNSEIVWLVRFQHVGPMLVEDLAAHTLLLSQKALELGGEYDGWDAEIVRDE